MIMEENDFIESAEKWFRSLPPEEAQRFLQGISTQSLLILFKYFPDKEIVQTVLKLRA